MDALDTLLKLLNRVKAHGWTDALADASGGKDGYKSSIENYPPYSEPLLTLRREMEKARVCIKAVDDIRRRLKQRLRALRRVSMPLVLEDGINRLPDDVLAVLFEIGHREMVTRDTYTRFSCIQVSHVSRRFRRISLQTPSLWTTIFERYGAGQIREFISRSGRLDLELNMPGSILRSEVELFLKALKHTSHRWSSLCLGVNAAECITTELGITDLPQLRQLTYISRAALSTFSMPRLLQVEGFDKLLLVKTTFLSRLTQVTLQLEGEDTKGIGEFANALHRMTNLKDLSLNLRNCTVARDSLPLDTTAFPKHHSVHIDKLAISIVGEMRPYSALLFDTLMHLTPSTLELSMNSKGMEKFLFNSKDQFFPYGVVVKLRISTPFDTMGLLVDLVKYCDIIRTIEFDTPKAADPFSFCTRLLREVDWERIRSIRHLRFIGCDELSEWAVAALANRFLRGNEKMGSQCLEVTSCKKISEDFLLELEDEFGDRLKWTL